MDPVTHVVSGLLAGQAVRDRFAPGRWIIWFTAIAAWIPDIDNLASYFGPEAYMRLHRGITHSLAGEAATALLLAFVWIRFKRRAPFWKLALLAYACQLMHSFLDVITSYGTQILQPFSDARVAFPVVYIVDPFFTGALLLLCLAGFVFKTRGKKLALVGLAVILGYPLANFGAREYAAASLEKALRAEGAAFDKVHVLPTAFTPLAWMAVADLGENRMVVGMDFLHAGLGPASRVLRRADPAQLRRFGEEAPIFSTYAWFTDYPMFEERETPQGRERIFSDARFMMMSPFLSDSWRQGLSAFTLTAELDEAGELKSWRFHQPGRDETTAQAAGAP